MENKKDSTKNEVEPKPATLETRIEVLTQQMNIAQKQAEQAGMTATRCSGAIEALTAVLNDQKEK